MKTIFKKVVIALIACTLITSCDAVKNANNTQKGAVIGTTTGAVLGGILGNNVGNKENSVLGAVIGGVVGGVAGGVIGKQMDKQAQKIEEEIPGAEVTRVGEGINVVFDENSGVYFDTNKYNINAKSKATLDKLVGIFKEYPDTNIMVEGHTDSSGNDAYNLTLSKNRANAVTSYLQSQGLSAGRFKTLWHGETLPKYDNSTADGRAKNRRVELGIVANEKMVEEAKTKVD